MTIKNHGGIFGRNPTFNTATFASINATGNVTFDGTLDVDTIAEKTSGSGVTIDGVLLQDNKIAKAGLPAGSVLQVVTGTSTTPVNTTSSSYQTTGLTASITPTSASSKIFIISSFAAYSPGTGRFTFYRNSTNVDNDLAQITSASGDDTISMSYLDSPATTSSTTYELRIRAAVTRVYVNDNSITGSITLMEVAG